MTGITSYRAFEGFCFKCWPGLKEENNYYALSITDDKEFDQVRKFVWKLKVNNSKKEKIGSQCELAWNYICSGMC